MGPAMRGGYRSFTMSEILCFTLALAWILKALTFV
jgi:hypothetical protein